MSKQTAVEYLIDELTNDIPFEIILKCHQTFIMAIELEREQIKEAFRQGELFSSDYYDGKNVNSQYYEITYKGGEK